jgi:methionyl-tRNA formyltransferase
MARILLIGLYKLGHLSLEAMLRRGMDVIGVVTKSDPLLDGEPLACLTRSRGLPLLVPPGPRDPAFVKRVKALHPDLIAVAGYHRLLPPRLLALPPRGVLNLHGSLLPRHRGPVPWKWSILNGETVTGMTVQVMSRRLDEGPILAQEACPILRDDTGDSLVSRLCVLGGPLLARTVEDFLAGRLVPRPQDEGDASYEGYPDDEDARICWEWEAERIRNLVRALASRPGAWTTCGGTRIRVRAADAAEERSEQGPGVVLRHSDRATLVSTGAGVLALSGISIDGETTILGPRRLESFGLRPGACLGTGAPKTSVPLP